MQPSDLKNTVGSEQDAPWSAGEEQEKYSLILGQAIERYLERLREVERRIADGEQDDGKFLPEVSAANEEVLQVCAQFDQEVKDEALVKTTRSYFRNRTHPMLSKSYAINRLRTWPQGYQGDYLTLEAAYRNTPMSDGVGYYLDKYLMTWPLAHALRGRIEHLAALLRSELAGRSNPRVLDIACGSCREILDLVPDIRRSAASVTCIDMDEDALAFSTDRLSLADLAPGQVSMIRYNALRMFDLDIATAEFGPQDIIYSVGYFDYLPDDFLVKMLRTLHALLNPGGKLIAAFKDAGRYRSQEYHWIADWDGFLQRRTADFERLIAEAGIPKSAVTESRDSTGIIIFYTTTK
jgi:extracellular factor (EF) 3-hydroxypalmitic acid methyl ester biosynthesis protein